ncbi:MAG: hypothetical protein LBV30_04910 [Propionibacteriaceae bacterium]|jgi:beta-mannosidase|nr:hypothetical protein [Propionibacteriaceae bacterium]
MKHVSLSSVDGQAWTLRPADLGAIDDLLGSAVEAWLADGGGATDGDGRSDGDLLADDLLSSLVDAGLVVGEGSADGGEPIGAAVTAGLPGVGGRLLLTAGAQSLLLELRDHFARQVTIPAAVPGCVHDDLLAAGLIPDPYLGVNEADLAWIGHLDWVYETTLPAVCGGDFDQLIDLVFDGLDTEAEVRLVSPSGDCLGAGLGPDLMDRKAEEEGGRLLLTSHNQHRHYRLRLAASDLDGSTRLSITFRDIYSVAARRRAAWGDYPAAYDEPFNYTRKMASNFGWDWGPTVVTAGVWRDVRLELWTGARLAEVRPHARLLPAHTALGLKDLLGGGTEGSGELATGSAQGPEGPAKGGPQPTVIVTPAEVNIDYLVELAPGVDPGSLELMASLQFHDPVLAAHPEQGNSNTTFTMLSHPSRAEAIDPETGFLQGRVTFQPDSIAPWQAPDFCLYDLRLGLFQPEQWPLDQGELVDPPDPAGTGVLWLPGVPHEFKTGYAMARQLRAGAGSNPQSVSGGGAGSIPQLDAWHGRIGFRDVELLTADDAIGRSFTIQLNGQPLFIRGFNWIPDDLLIHRVTKDDYRARLQDAVDAGANLIRVWGGGIYESDDFYDLCDELGLLVWQDCLFACAAYPETPEFEAEVAAEVRDNAVRLMRHPSLALWNGCNENIWGRVDWGWEQALAGRGWGAKYYYQTIPQVLAAIGDDRPYWPGSPASGQNPGETDTSGQPLHPDDPDWGCHHSWDVWNQIDYSHYQSSRPRFVAEFGWCGPASYATLREAVGVDHLQPWDDTLMWHYKSQEGGDKLRRAITDGFTEPTDFAGWHYAAQVMQARAVRFGIDWWRSLWPRCAGAIVWQLNDCWPVTSWAAVDSVGVRKPVWHAIKSAFADRMGVLFAMPAGSLVDGVALERPAVVVTLLNQTDQPWAATVRIARVSLDGLLRAWSSLVCRVKPHASLQLALPPELAPEPSPRIDALGGEVFDCGLADDELLVLDVVDATALADGQPGSALTPSPDPKRLSGQSLMVSAESGPAESEAARWRPATRVALTPVAADNVRLGRSQPVPVDVDLSRRRVLIRPDKELVRVAPSYSLVVDADADGGRLTITAETVLRDLLLQADRFGGQAPLELVTLLPGESHCWTVVGLGRPLTMADLTRPGVVLSAADAEGQRR